MYDVILKGGLIVDGTGSRPYRGNVAVFGSSIALITDADISRAKTVVDCTGCIVAPGFIDIHTHSDFLVLRDPQAKARIGQGITTDVSGNCGIGTFPYVNPELKEFVGDVLGEYPDWSWSDFASMKRYYEERGIGNNQMFLVSHAAVRVAVMGPDSKRAATDEEIDNMCFLLDHELKAGARGFSTGLFYAPCVYAEEKELLALLSVVRSNGGIFTVHHRCEGDDVLTSLKEVLDLADRTGVRLEVSHLKAIGPRNQKKVPEMLSLIEEYRAKGVDVKFDQYPYTFGSTSLFALLPPRILQYSKLEQRMALQLESEREEMKKEIMHPDGWDSAYEMVGPDAIKAIFLSSNPDLNGKTLSEIAEIRGIEDPLDALFDILSEETGLAVMTDEVQSTESLEKIMAHPLMCFGTDSLYSSPVPHPRSYHSTVEFLATYVRDRHVLSLEEAVRRMTSESASRIGLRDRGVVKEGKAADLVVFSLEDLSYGEGEENQGFKAVLVNGKVAYLDGQFYASQAGMIL